MTPDNTFITSLSQQIVAVVLPLLASTLVALVVLGLKKLGLSIDADKQAQLEYVAKQAVLKVEEQVSARVAGAVDASLGPITSKLNMAVVDVIAKLPRVSKQEAEDAIHAALPQLGLGAAAGAAALGKALRTPDGQ